MASTPTKPKLGTRAVKLRIEPGNVADCLHCGVYIKFNSRLPESGRRQIVCNIYKKRKWDRVEHYHQDCYDEVGRPYGDPIPSSKLKEEEKRYRKGLAPVKPRIAD
jgi:hypothetical protein